RRVIVGEGRLLRPRVTFALAGKLLVDPVDVEEFEERKIEDVGPHDGGRAVIAMVVPSAVRGEDEVAALGPATLAFDRRVAAIVGEDRPAGVGRVHVHRRDVARVVDRDGAADRARDLQSSAEPRIDEEELLPVGELDRRGAAALDGFPGDFGEAVEIGADLAPAPMMRRRLHLAGPDSPAGDPPLGVERGLAKPRALRRRVGLGAQPDVVLPSLGVEPLHRLACVGHRSLPRHRGSMVRRAGRGKRAAAISATVAASRRGAPMAATIEERLREVEDRLEIYNLIASHPPSADTGSGDYTRTVWTEDGVFDRGAQFPRPTGRDAIAAGSSNPDHHKALEEGIAHVSGLPYVRVTGDTAFAISYL